MEFPSFASHSAKHWAAQQETGRNHSLETDSTNSSAPLISMMFNITFSFTLSVLMMHRLHTCNQSLCGSGEMNAAVVPLLNSKLSINCRVFTDINTKQTILDNSGTV